MNFLFLKVLHIVLKVPSRFECPNGHSNSIRSRNADKQGQKFLCISHPNYLESQQNLDTFIYEKFGRKYKKEMKSKNEIKV